MTHRQPLETIRHGDHLCWFSESADDRRGVLAAYIADGVARNERVVCLLDITPDADILSALADAGLDGGQLVEKGQLVFQSARDAYLHEGRFDGEAMLSMVGEVLRSSLAEGFSGVRGLGEMTWFPDSSCAVDDLLRYESRLNEVLAGQPVSTICLYPRDRFPTAVLNAVLDTHPLVLEGGRLLENPFYVEPSRYLSPDRDEIEFGRRMKSLVQREELRSRAGFVEREFNAIAESTSDCILVWDREYNYLYANQAAIDHVGATREQVIGRNIRDGLGHVPEFMEIWMKRIDDVFATGQELVVQDSVPVGGALIHSESKLTPIRDDAGHVRAVGVVYRDVTELRSARDRYQEIVENINDVLFSVDLEGTIRFVNSVATSLFGFTPKEAIGKPFADFIHPDDLQSVSRAFRDVLSGNLQSSEYRVRCRDGEYRWVRSSSRPVIENGKPVGLRGMLSDISELRRKENLHSRILETTTDAYWHIGLQGEIIDANPAAAEMLGYGQRELIGRSLRDVEVKENFQETQRRIQSIIASGSGRFETRHRRKDGHLLDVDVSVSYIPDDGGSLVAFVRDISHQKRIRSALHLQRDLAYTLANAESLNDALGACVDSAIRASGLDAAAIYLIDPSTNLLRLEIARGVGEEFIRNVSEYRPESSNHKMVSAGKPVHTSYAELGLPIDIHGESLNAVSVVPMIHRGRVIGCLNAASHTRDRIPESGARAIEAMASNVSSAIARLQGERDLRESEAILNDAQEIAGIGSFVYDIANDSMEYSKNMLKMAGINESATRKGLSGVIHSLVHPDDRDRVRNEMDAMLREARTWPMEFRVIRADGEERIWRSQSRFELNGDGRPVRCIGLHYDITEQRRADENMRVMAELLDASPASITVHDFDGNFLYANRKSLEMHGFSLDELLQRNLREIDNPENAARIKDRMRILRNKGEASFESIHLDRNGREIPLQVWTKVTKWGERDVILSVAIDMTERQQLEERIRQMEKMDAVGQLAGGIAHDFNNQLAGVLGYADMLRRRIEDDELQRFAENILTAARRAGDLTKKLLAFARKGQYKSVAVDIHPIIHEVVEILSHSIDKRIQMKQRLEASPSCTTGDPTQIQNALLNLAINARDAMPEGGELILETSISELTGEYCQSLPYALAPGQYIKVSVTDTGSGMDEATIERCFEPFFTTKEQGKGTGMGLAAVYGTVKHHNGAVNVYSEPGQGTTFRIYLPVREGACECSKGDSEVLPAIRSGRILVVDDEDLLRSLAQDMLAAIGHQVHACDNGQDAVAYYRQHWREIDLVILDMIMPRMNGRDAFVALRSINPNARVILASGYSLTSDMQNLIDDGALGFVEKPFEHAALCEAVAKALVPK